MKIARTLKSIDIPRTMTKEGLNLLTSIVSEQSKENNEGVILELGPLFGSSTDAISKGRSEVNPSKIVSIDTFEAAPWVKKRLGFDLSRERFDHYTSHIKNLEVIEGFSPGVVENTWKQKIDIYFDDATHGNPNWMENFNFYKPFFGKNTIICGDDFAYGWPDIVKNVRQLSEKYKKNFYVIGRLWAMGLSNRADLVIQRALNNLYPKMIGYNIHTVSQLSSGQSLAPCWSENLHINANQLEKFKITRNKKGQLGKEKTSLIISIETLQGLKKEYHENQWIELKDIKSISFSFLNRIHNINKFFQISTIIKKKSSNNEMIAFGSTFVLDNDRINCLRLIG